MTVQYGIGNSNSRYVNSNKFKQFTSLAYRGFATLRPFIFNITLNLEFGRWYSLYCSFCEEFGAYNCYFVDYKYGI